MKNDLGLRISHETIKNVHEIQKYSSIVTRKKPLLLSQNAENRLRFPTEHVALPPAEYWDDVIFSDETKIILYYHDGSQIVDNCIVIAVV